MPRRCNSPEPPSLSPTASSFSPTGLPACGLGRQLARSSIRSPTQGWHLTWFDRVGRRSGSRACPAPGQYNGVVPVARWQPDSCTTWPTPSRRLDQPAIIWIARRWPRGVTTRLTFDPSSDFSPVCAPGTGDEIVFASLRDGPAERCSGSWSRRQAARPCCCRHQGPKIPTDWSRDGNGSSSTRRIDPATGVGRLDAAARRTGTPHPLLPTRRTRSATPGCRPTAGFSPTRSLQGERIRRLRDQPYPASRREVADFPRRRAARRCGAPTAGRCITSSGQTRRSSPWTSAAGRLAARRRPVRGSPSTRASRRASATTRACPFAVTARRQPLRREHGRRTCRCRSRSSSTGRRCSRSDAQSRPARALTAGGRGCRPGLARAPA